MGQTEKANHGAIGDSLRYAGHFDESIEYYDSYLNSDTLSQDLKVKYLIRRSISLGSIAEDSLALVGYDHVKTLLTEDHDTLNIFFAHALNNAAVILKGQAKWTESFKEFDSALSIYQYHKDEVMESMVRSNRAEVYYKQGRLKEALTELSEAALQLEGLSDDYRLGEVYSQFGVIQNELGDYQSSIESYLKSIAHREKCEDIEGLSSTYNNLGGVLRSSGRLDSSLLVLRQSLGLMEDMRSRNIGKVHHNVGETYASLEEFDLAEVHFQQAIHSKSYVQDSAGVVFSQLALADLLITTNQESSAFQELNSVRLKLDMDEASQDLKKYYELLKEYYKTKGKKDSALWAFEESDKIGRLLSREEYLSELALLQESFNANSRESKIVELENSKEQLEEEVLTLSQKFDKWRNETFTLISILIFILVSGIVIIRIREQGREISELKAKQEGAEEEKKRLSMDLHDVTGSSLRMIRYKLEELAETVEEGEATDVLQGLLSESEQVAKEVIGMSHTLHHPKMERRSFSVLLSDFSTDWAENHRVRVDFQNAASTELDGLSLEVKSHLYRCVQEAFINVKRHAAAQRILMSVNKSPKRLILSIEDDGIGLKSPDAGGIGLSNMKNRMKLIGGRLTLKPLADGGACILFDIPLNLSS